MRFPTFRTLSITHFEAYLIPALISLVAVCAQFSPLAAYFTWDRDAILQGQWWRILSGNLTHTNLTHLGMNLAALWLITLIFRPSLHQFLLIFFVCSGSVGLSLFWTDIQRYVGLSGVLHGLFAGFALLEICSGRQSSWLLFIGIIGKVAWEQYFGASATTMALIQAPVAIQAHLAGLISGSLLAALMQRSIRPVAVQDKTGK